MSLPVALVSKTPAKMRAGCKRNIAFVHNFASHYTVKTFELLSASYDIDFYFYSDGREWYWSKEHGVRGGNFQHHYLPGFNLGGTRFTPSLPMRLLRENYDVYISSIDGRFALPVTYLAARLRRKPFILWTGIWYRIMTPFHQLVGPLIRRVYREADAIVVYGEHVRDFLESEGVSPERVFVAPHAVDNEVYNRSVSSEEKEHLRTRLGIGLDSNVVLFMGRLEEVKGLEYLIEAFASLGRDDTHLIIGGTGTLAPFLARLVQEKGLSSKVRFTGHVPTQETIVYYSIASVLVLPSVSTPAVKEAWGLVINEAFNQGLPVIATHAVGAAAGDLVRDGENGLVIPERNSQALAQALREILENSVRRQRLSEGASRTIAAWDKTRMVSGFVKAIEHVLPSTSVDAGAN